MKIILASDHAGYALKEYLKARLATNGNEVDDLGAFSAEKTDYIYYTLRAVRHLIDQPDDRAIFTCGNGLAMALLANRFPGMRAAVCHDPFTARTAVEMANVNIISFGQRVVGPELAWELTQTFLAARYGGLDDSRYARRLAKVEQVEALLYQTGWLERLDDYLRTHAPDISAHTATS